MCKITRHFLEKKIRSHKLFSKTGCPSPDKYYLCQQIGLFRNARFLKGDAHQLQVRVVTRLIL